MYVCKTIYSPDWYFIYSASGIDTDVSERDLELDDENKC